MLRFEDVTKVFRSSIAGRHLYTLGPLNFDVRRGEIFGYLGPNGAGKTTTIKLAMGLLKPSAGRVVCFGRPASSLDFRGRTGFLPEQPYFYQHLTAFELLEFFGEMSGMGRDSVRARANELLTLTGLSGHRDTPLSKFSKGMLQRIGLAQALVNDPELVVLDEPLSGLDPVGRRELRDLIVRLKTEGRTVFLSSHILQDVEMICDRVAILSAGRVLDVAAVSDVLYRSMKSVEILVEGLPPGKVRDISPGRVTATANRTVITLPGDSNVNAVMGRIIEAGAKVLAVTPLRQTLEDYFMSRIQSPGCEPAAKPRPRRKVFQKVGKGD